MKGYKKILLITSEFPPGPGGIGNHAYNLAKYLRMNDIRVRVLAVSDFVNKKEEEDFDALQNFDVFRFPRFKSRSWTYLRRIKAILFTLRNKDFTHVIFSGRFSLLASLSIRKRSKLKFVAIAHGGDINPENSMLRNLVNRALRKMDLIIPVSKHSASKISAKINPDKIKVIPNGFDFDEIDSLKINEKILSNGSVNLITVGTVWPRKGHHNVINALPKIISEHPHAKYNIVGRLADLSKVKNLFEDPEIKVHLNVHGSISNNEMFSILNQSQIFIMLSEAQSSGDFEGFGIAVLEANYFGLPAIGSKGSGLEDSINDGVSGILVDPKNPDEVSEAVNKILLNYQKFSQAAREWSLKHHWSNIIKRYIEAVENIKLYVRNFRGSRF